MKAIKIKTTYSWERVTITVTVDAVESFSCPVDSVYKDTVLVYFWVNVDENIGILNI